MDGREETSDREEDDTDTFMEASGSEPKAKEDIRSWKELQEQLKSDWLEGQKKKETPTRLNKLTILQNFAMLRIKGVGRITASEEIARLWKDGAGAYFTHQIRFIAQHYQLFEELPAERRGAAGGQSLLKDERVQAAARTHLSSVPTGKVTPKQFHQALNKRILPSLGFNLTDGLSECTAQRWLLLLGWRHTRVKKGVYMDGHERPDVIEYRNNVFLPLMASYETRMV
jgi:hypothetical protein